MCLVNQILHSNEAVWGNIYNNDYTSYTNCFGVSLGLWKKLTCDALGNRGIVHMERFCLYYLFTHICAPVISKLLSWWGSFSFTVGIRSEGKRRENAHKQKWVWPLWEMWWTSRGGGGSRGLGEKPLWVGRVKEVWHCWWNQGLELAHA